MLIRIVKMVEGGSHSDFEREGSEAMAVRSLKLSSCITVLTL